MRKVIVSIYTTLDGFICGPKGEMDWVLGDEEFIKYSADQLNSMGTLLLGRVTYELFASYWPFQTDPQANILNSLPKVVFSKTLEKADWNHTRLVKENIVEELSKLKQEPGKDMVIFGGSDLITSLSNLGLIDEYRIWIHPVILGAGKPLFQGITSPIHLKGSVLKTFKSGVVILSYEA